MSSDFRDLVAAEGKGNKRASLALSMFSYSVAKYIGSYAAAMNGVDVIAFTAGIGENTPSVREDVCGYLGFMGVDIDEKVNVNVHGEEKLISSAASKVKVYVIPTNEELAIARETVSLVG